jgi:hypothetical protein
VNLIDAIMMGGLVLILGACTLMVGTALWERRTGKTTPAATIDDHPGTRLDLYLCLVWSGMVLVQVSNIALHIQERAIQNVSGLGWLGTAGTISACGVFLGRLLLRREIRWYKNKREQQSRDALA